MPLGAGAGAGVVVLGVRAATHGWRSCDIHRVRAVQLGCAVGSGWDAFHLARVWAWARVWLTYWNGCFGKLEGIGDGRQRCRRRESESWGREAVPGLSKPGSKRWAVR